MENSRDIKFRAWHEASKQMYKWDMLTINSDCIETNFDGLFTTDEDDVNKLILMQYTGIKDKNGKEGYHQDIINHTVYGKGVIRWYSNGWAIHLESMYGYEGWMESGILEKSEIIGNIYENPKLVTS